MASRSITTQVSLLAAGTLLGYLLTSRLSSNTNPSSSIDDEISLVLDFWFSTSSSTSYQDLHRYKWMSTDKNQSSIDAEISSRFSALTVTLATDANYRAAFLSSSKHPIRNLHAQIAAIIVLDQFPRHLRRLHNPSHNGVALPPLSTTDALALSIASSLPPSNALTIPMQVFALMPLRHSSTLPDLKKVMLEIDEMDKQVADGDRGEPNYTHETPLPTY